MSIKNVKKGYLTFVTKNIRPNFTLNREPLPERYDKPYRPAIKW
nr:hypothetical protein [Mucilaginibacter sp. FT3.2]